jgi:predicted permease
MTTSLLSNFDREKLYTLAPGLVIPFASIGLCYLAALGIAKLIKVPRSRFGAFVSMFFVSNSIFIGLPVNLALFGDKSVPYVLLYYIANTSFFWTIGVYGISCDGGQPEKFSLREVVKKLISPPLMGFIAALIILALNIHLPRFVLDTCKYLGNLTTPLSMLFIGITIHSIDLREVKFDFEKIVLLFGRFVISPLIVLLLVKFHPVPTIMRDVFFMQAAMPVMTNSAVVTKAYNADYKYSAIMIFLSAIVSLIFIPLYMVLLSII